MAARHRVEVSEVFVRMLAQIEAYLDAHDSAPTYELLLDELTSTVIPNLETFPQLGPLIQHRPARSAEAARAFEHMERQLRYWPRHAEVREYLLQDYRILYAFIKQGVYLLSIRHQRQHDARSRSCTS